MTRRRIAAEPTLTVGGPVVVAAGARARVHGDADRTPRTLGGSPGSDPTLTGSFRKPRAGSRARTHRLPHLAVLPLRGSSLATADEYLTVGLTGELISVLSQIGGLRVISHTSVMPYRGTRKPIAQVGAELGADSVLKGSVRKSRDRLEVTVQLVDPATDRRRWENTFNRPLEGVATLPIEVAENAAGSLNVEVRSVDLDALRERPTANLAAYECYLRGIEAWRRSEDDLETLGRAVWGWFEQAIANDPRFASAYSSLANLLLEMMGAAVSTTEVVPRARAAVAKALELDPRSSDAYAARGNLLAQADHDWRGSEASYRRAIALNPSSSVARFGYGCLLHLLQRAGEAKKQFRIAIDLDPLWLLPRLNLVWTEAFLGRLDAAASESERTAQRFPSSDCARVQRAWIYAFAGRKVDAIRLVNSCSRSPSPDPMANALAVLAYLGQPGPARKMLRDWRGGRLSKHLDPEGAAGLYALTGEKESALDLLEEEFGSREFTAWGTYQAAWYDRIRDDPRVIALLRAQQLPTTLSRPRRPGAHN